MTDNKPERATGGPINPGRAYWIGEDGPAPLVVPHSVQPIDLSKYGDGATFTLDNSDATFDRDQWLSGLQDATFEVSGLFDADLAIWKTMHRHQPVSVSVEVPASRWQAFKARLKRIRGLGWIPVRYAWKTQFVGQMQPWPNGDGFTISTNPEETQP